MLLHRAYIRAHWRYLVAGFLAVMILAITTAPAIADDDDYSQYEPTGIGEFFPSPEIDPGLGKTLYEAYPVSAWSWDYKDDSWWNIGGNAIDGAFNGLANVVFMLNQFLVRGSISMTWSLQNTDANTSIGDNMSPIIETIAGNLGEWMIPSALAIGTFMALASMGNGGGTAGRNFGIVALLGLVALSLMIRPDVWVGTIQTIQSLGHNTVATATSFTGSKVKIPFDGPQATFNPDDPQSTHMRQMADNIWRTYVATPWCVGEFGTITACQEWGNEILSMTGPERISFINDTIQAGVGGDNSNAYRLLTGRDGVSRLIIAIVSLVVSAVFSLLQLILAIIGSVFDMLVWLMLIVGPFFVFLAPISGFLRQWASRWGLMLLSFTLFGFLSYLVLSGAITISAITMSLAGENGWLVAAIQSIIAIFASVLMVPNLRKIMNAESSGAGRLLGGLFMAKALLSRRRSSTKGANRQSTNRRSTTEKDQQRRQENTGGRGPENGKRGANSPSRPPKNPTPLKATQTASETPKHSSLPTSNPTPESKHTHEKHPHPKPTRTTVTPTHSQGQPRVGKTTHTPKPHATSSHSMRQANPEQQETGTPNPTRHTPANTPARTNNEQPERLVKRHVNARLQEGPTMRPTRRPNATPTNNATKRTPNMPTRVSARTTRGTSSNTPRKQLV